LPVNLTDEVHQRLHALQATTPIASLRKPVVESPKQFRTAG
jgi:hypothetical protein